MIERMKIGSLVRVNWVSLDSAELERAEKARSPWLTGCGIILKTKAGTRHNRVNIFWPDGTISCTMPEVLEIINESR
tara:strand:- start:206 stop:436 length:231 start_codon:yes stop_codon:yes gene_type:complete